MASLSTTYDDATVTTVVEASGLVEVTIAAFDGRVLRDLSTYEEDSVDLALDVDLAELNEVVHLMWQDEQAKASSSIVAPNGCTGVPDGWWGGCCDYHDVCYDACAGRLGCDNALYSCMVAVGAGEALAGAYFLGVRLFGGSHYCNAA